MSARERASRTYLEIIFFIEGNLLDVRILVFSLVYLKVASEWENIKRTLIEIIGEVNNPVSATEIESSLL